jgi:hypothetical protein
MTNGKSDIYGSISASGGLFNLHFFVYCIIAEPLKPVQKRLQWLYAQKIKMLIADKMTRAEIPGTSNECANMIE